MNSILIIGAGAQARYIINTVQVSTSSGFNNSNPRIIGLIDTHNNPSIWSTKIDGFPVLGNLDTLDDYPPSPHLRLFTAISNSRMKRTISVDLLNRGYEFGKLVHPSAIIASRVSISYDVVINAHVVVETGSNIGHHVIIHAGAIIEHDNQIGDFVNIGPGVTTAGRVNIRPGATVFTGAVIKPDIEIGENSIVGAGAVVIRDVSPCTIVAGVPARVIGVVES